MDAIMMATTPALLAGGMVLAWYTLAIPCLIGRCLLRRLRPPRPRRRSLDMRMWRSRQDLLGRPQNGQRSTLKASLMGRRVWPE